MKRQRTLRKSFTLEGKGLHTGLSLSVTFHPAPEDHGYKFRRTDLWGMPVIDALAENVVRTERSTTISEHGVEVGTIEHALAALYGCEIDNCLVDINGSEIPILDGSAIAYVKGIDTVGVQYQDSPRRYVKLSHQRIKISNPDTGSRLVMLPYDSFSIQSTIKYKSPILKRQCAIMSDLSDFAVEIASARTFVFIRDIEGLLQNNLIKGGDLDNAIVIYDAPIKQENIDRFARLAGVKGRDANRLGYILNKPLTYENEPARHKILDLLGDLALVGAFIKGRIIVECPGHNINTLFAQAIRLEYLRKERREVELYMI